MRWTSTLAAIAALVGSQAACSLIFAPDPSDLRERADGDLDTVQDPALDGTDGTDGTDLPADTSTDSPSDVEGDAPELPCTEPSDTPVSFATVTDVDILVVVDDSPGMTEEQGALLPEMSHLLECLTTTTCLGESLELESIHLGVIGTNLGAGPWTTYSTCVDDGDDGALLHSPDPLNADCDASYPDWLEWTPGVEHADVADAFECISQLGVDGCGYEQPLEAAHRFLTVHAAPGGSAEGFLRSDSLLIVIFLTDENDCSVLNYDLLDPDATELGMPLLRCFDNDEYLYDPTRYQDAFREARGNPQRLVVAMVTGVPMGAACEGPATDIGGCLDETAMQEAIGGGTELNPACYSASGNATPGRRQVDLAIHMPYSGFVTSICNPDMVTAFYDINAAIYGRIQDSQTDRLLPIGPAHVKDPENPCHCLVECELAEYLWGETMCPEGRWLAEVMDDGAEGVVARCIVPQIPLVLENCSDADCSMAMAEPDPADGNGWYWHPNDVYNRVRLQGFTPDPAAWYAVHCCPP